MKGEIMDGDTYMEMEKLYSAADTTNRRLRDLERRYNDLLLLVVAQADRINKLEKEVATRGRSLGANGEVN
jgi:hypothetical protein